MGVGRLWFTSKLDNCRFLSIKLCLSGFLQSGQGRPVDSELVCLFIHYWNPYEPTLLVLRVIQGMNCYPDSLWRPLCCKNESTLKWLILSLMVEILHRLECINWIKLPPRSGSADFSCQEPFGNIVMLELPNHHAVWFQSTGNTWVISEDWEVSQGSSVVSVVFG